MFAAFVHIDGMAGCRAIIQEVSEVDGVEGIKLVKPVAGGSPRVLHSFEHCFDTRQVAADWVAGEIEAYAQKCLDQAAAIRGDAVSAERCRCV
jgi:hypothetical protein